MDNLKPCPFCGGEASKRLFYKGKYRIHCNVCEAHSGDVCDTEAEAANTWNTRAERTCKVIMEQHNDYGYQTQVDDYSFSLSCGHVVTWDDLPDYCPYCGAKVVE